MLRDSTTVAVVVVRTRPRAIPLAMIHMRKSIHSIEAFCLRMLHKKYFNVSNRWYAPDLHVSKMAIVATNFSVMEVVFFFFPFVTEV